ncbi:MULTISPECIES: GNAT family N-acetyltransferase [Pseudomonas]|uniref:GNAT family N-acetyltransferase n=1 Tax=Pseudomonadaceae TaxID=135621 RepID=UPI00040F64D8|nr:MULTISPECIES: GNAT family N-acetyltransferase [Pseudomonas]MDE3737573.1 GNAT family N-acetyltransferase [Pseudomonas resinovorans]
MLNRFRLYRERGWESVDAGSYRGVWERFGGSVITHPQVVERLSALAGIPVRYLGYRAGGELQAAIPTWGRSLALSRQVLKRKGMRNLFDLGNAEVILPVAPGAGIALRHECAYLSELNLSGFRSLRPQKAQLAMARTPEAWSKKFRYNQRRELRLFEEAGGEVRPVAGFAPAELAAIYTELFERRWGFEVPGKGHLAEVFRLLHEYLSGSLLLLNGAPVAVQVLYRAESPDWISYEYINGGVDPRAHHLSPGSVLSFINTQAAWEDARARGKMLRYSFGRADREYKDRWCDRVAAFRV